MSTISGSPSLAISFLISSLILLAYPDKVSTSDLKSESFDQYTAHGVYHGDVRSREWEAPPSEKLWLVGEDEEDIILLNPLILKADDDNRAYVMDYGDMSLKVFSAEGDLVQSVGRGRGQGPGEFLNPTDFDIDAESRLWIVDPPNARISIHDRDGTVAESIAMSNIIATRIAVNTNNDVYYVLMQAPTEDSFIAAYSLSGELLSTFGELIDDQVRDGMALDGRITAAEDGLLYYAPMWAGYLYAFDSDGVEHLSVEAIQPSPFPEIVVDERGGRRVNPDSRPNSRDIGVVGQQLFAMAYADSSGTLTRALDLYEKASGDYQYTIPLPSQARFAWLTEDRVYTLSETSLTAWRRPDM